MSSILQSYGPSVAAVVGLLLIVLAFMSAGDSFLIAGAIFFGAATIAAQLGCYSNS